MFVWGTLPWLVHSTQCLYCLQKQRKKKNTNPKSTTSITCFLKLQSSSSNLYSSKPCLKSHIIYIEHFYIITQTIYSNLASLTCSVARSGRIPCEWAIFIHLELIQNGLLLVVIICQSYVSGLTLDREPTTRKHHTTSHTLTHSCPCCECVSIFTAVEFLFFCSTGLSTILCTGNNCVYGTFFC